MRHSLTAFALALFACSPPPVASPGPSAAEERAAQRAERERLDQERTQKDQEAIDRTNRAMTEAHEADMAKGREPRGVSDNPRQSPPRQFPDSISGFKLGVGFFQAARLCVDSGGGLALLDRHFRVTDQENDVTHFICTKEPVETGFDPEIVGGRRCASGNLCEVTLGLRQEFPAEVAISACKKMRDRYGNPNEEEGKSFLDTLQNCRKPGAKMRRDIWTWYIGGVYVSRVIVAMSCKTKATPSVIYQDAEAMAARVEELIEREKNYLHLSCESIPAVLHEPLRDKSSL
jgi:hypothetical protein